MRRCRRSIPKPRCSSSPPRPSPPARPCSTRRPRAAGSWRTPSRSRAGAPLRRGLDQHRGDQGVRHRPGQHVPVLGLGRRALFGVVGDRPADRAVGRLRLLQRFPGRRARDGPALHASAAGAEHAGAAGPGRLLEPPVPRLRFGVDRAVPPGPEPLPGLPAAARNGEQRQARDQERPAGRHPDLPGDLGRLRHQRPARLLPAAAPGHRPDADRLHRQPASRARTGVAPRGAAGELLRPVGSLHARQRHRRSARRPAGAGHWRRPRSSAWRRTRPSPATARATPS